MVSRSPDAEAGDSDPYRDAWRNTASLLRQGHSFSGRERNCAYLNLPGLNSFANVSAVTGLDFPDDGRALAVADWDHDGDLDVWLHNRTGPRLRLMLNQTSQTDLGNQFIAFRLQGTASNRDAIGARVTVSNADRPIQQQTLMAGDAYLSQSSKVLHFGLGNVSTVDSVVVRWPNGKSEEFGSLTANHRYLLTEGSSNSIREERRHSINLEASVQPQDAPGETSELTLASPIPLPILPYSMDSGATTTLNDLPAKHHLIVIWASWCASCQDELKALSNSKAQLTDAGIQILALSVDGLDPNHATNVSDARQVIEQLPSSIPWGMATPELIDKLRLLESLLVNQPPPLSVPMNLLVGPQGSLLSIIYGPADSDALVAAVEARANGKQELRQYATPFDGRWITAPRRLALGALGRAFRQEGFDTDYLRFLNLDVNAMTAQRTEIISEQARQAIDQRIANTCFALGVASAAAGGLADAEQYFLNAIDSQPDHLDALINLGTLAIRAQQIERAIEYFERAIAVDDQSQGAHQNLALVLSANNRFEAAIPHFRKAIDSSSEPRVRSAYIAALLAMKQFGDAKSELEIAVSLNPQNFSSSLALAWLLATCPKDEIRDGERALELATRLHVGRGRDDPLTLDLLGAAQAESGDYSAAQKSLVAALEQVENQNPAAQQAFQKRLKSYRQSQAYRDADGQYP